MRIVDQLKIDEGFRSYAYQDTEGFWTIGYGRLIDKRLGGGITEDEAEYLLRNDIESKKKDLLDHLPWAKTLDPVRQDVLINMCFNLGIGRLKKFSKTLALIRYGDYQQASKEMLRSKWARQVGARADRLSKMMETGQYL